MGVGSRGGGGREGAMACRACGVIAVERVGLVWFGAGWNVEFQTWPVSGTGLDTGTWTGREEGKGRTKRGGRRVRERNRREAWLSADEGLDGVSGGGHLDDGGRRLTVTEFIRQRQ